MWPRGARRGPDDRTAEEVKCSQDQEVSESHNPRKRMSKVENSLNREEDSEVCSKREHSTCKVPGKREGPGRQLATKIRRWSDMLLIKKNKVREDYLGSEAKVRAVPAGMRGAARFTQSKKKQRQRDRSSRDR